MSDNIIFYPVSRIVRAYLIEQSVGVAYSVNADWAIATVAEQVRPFNCITIFDEVEEKRRRYHSGGVQDDPVVSIRVRSTTAESGQYKAKKIMEAMDAIARWTWVGDSTEYSQTVMVATARRVRGILPLGTDDNGRWIFTLEYALVIQSIT